jgi:hypothetical protein
MSNTELTTNSASFTFSLAALWPSRLMLKEQSRTGSPANPIPAASDQISQNIPRAFTFIGEVRHARRRLVKSGRAPRQPASRTGQGLTTFERAMDRDERLMAILGARLLETQKRVGETSEAIELRQSGEYSILGSLAASVSTSLTHVLRWAYWWNSTVTMPDDVSQEQVLVELNTDYSTRGLTATEIAAVVSAWQNGALSRESMLDIFRRGEVLPEGRTNEEEERLVKVGLPSKEANDTKTIQTTDGRG